MILLIHVVQSGQTLYSIAQTYGTSITAIVEANEIPNPDQLVVGQAIVIPIIGQFYTVQRGDSLWSISRKFGTSVFELAAVNGLNINQLLPIGLRLYIPERPKRQAEFNVYLEPLGAQVSQNLEDSARETAPYLTYLTHFSFQAQRDGSLKEPPIGNLQTIANEQNLVFSMAVTNLENNQFSAELGHILLTDDDVQTKFLNNIVATAKKYQFRDIHFDFEYLFPADREAYNQFLRRARDRIHSEGWFISSALAPKTSAEQKGQWYEAHDYKAHGEIVDWVVIMTYEWGYSGGPPMAVSPIGPVRDVLEYAVTEIPPQKIMMGQNLYGYDWTLPFVQGGPYAKAISPQQAIQLASKYNAEIKFDEEAQAPTFRYTDENQKVHEVWFEDARSIQAKFDLVKELHLRGVSYWKLGISFPQNWLLIIDNFQVVKK